MTRAAMVRRFGDGDLIACTTLQHGLAHFETSFGFWAYRDVGSARCALGGPICAPGDRPEMVARFLRRARRPICFYVRDDVARMLSDAGLRTVGIGVDRNVDVCSLSEQPPKPVRGAQHKAQKAGITLEEIAWSEVDRPRLDAITRAYLARAEVTIEMAFLNRPMSYDDDGMRRLFVLRRRAATFGYAVLNPVFSEGRVVSYLLDILRFEPTPVWGVWLSSVYTFASLLRAEGVGLTVGFCPLHSLHHPAGASRVLSWQLDGMERVFSNAQYLRRLYQLKALLPGTWETRSLASHTRLAPAVLHAFMGASGVRFSYLFGPDLLKVLSRGLRGEG